MAERQDDPLDPPGRHQELKAAFRRAFGGVIGTGGRGAIALRCDHGLAPFRDLVLPLVRDRGLVVSQAVNPRNWHYPENTGVTPEDLDSWVAAGDVEIWNHSASHAAAETPSALRDQIVGGLTELEAQLPSARGAIWGWAPPGVPGGYAGYDGGKRPDGWATTAGRLILEHHAVAQGSLYGTALRPLDARPRAGLARFQLDSRDLAAILEKIDLAAETRQGLQLMIHPSVIGKEGFLSSQQVEQVLDRVISHRDAGRVMTLSPYQLLLADSARAPKTVP